MRYLTAEELLFIHARVIAEAGGSHGVRGLNLLEAVVARPKATFEGKELHEGVFNKAAVLMQAIISSHPFLDGNKRTGVASTSLFLLRNGWRLSAPANELEEMAVRVTVEKVQIAELANWLRSHSKRMRSA